MNSGMRDTGTDTSWAMLPPADTCASARLSRIFHSFAACAPDAAISASRTSPASWALASASASGACSEPGAPWPVTFSSTYQGWALAHGIFVSRHARQQEIDDGAADQLEGGQRVAQARLQVAEQRHAGRGLSMPTHAVSLAVGLGNSRSTAAVTMPSVPSAPMKSCFRS